jgi:hypothetical protein
MPGQQPWGPPSIPNQQPWEPQPLNYGWQQPTIYPGQFQSTGGRDNSAYMKDQTTNYQVSVHQDPLAVSRSVDQT